MGLEHLLGSAGLGAGVAFTVQAGGYASRALLQRLGMQADYVQQSYVIGAAAGVLAAGAVMPLPMPLPAVMVELGVSAKTAASLSDMLVNLGALSIVNTVTGAAGAAVGYFTGAVMQNGLYGSRVWEHVKAGTAYGAMSGSVLLGLLSAL